MTAPNAKHYADLARKLMAESRARREQADEKQEADELAGDTTPTPERPADATAWAERARAEMNRAKESTE